jgi:hypothetical protein
MHQEIYELTSCSELGNVAIEVEAIQTLYLQGHVLGK